MEQADSEPVTLASGDALVVVDLQRDFLPGGALAVDGGDRIVPAINRYVERFERAGRLVVLTRDWHPPDHLSFATRGGRWPPHGIAGSAGADFAPGLLQPAATIVISKARTPDAEAYSGFDGTPLADWLHRLGVSRLFVGGLATDYCVRATVLDALRLDFTTFLLTDAVQAVNAKPGDGERALREMAAAGATALEFGQIAPEAG